MCTTLQFIYSCRHSATEPFRDALCPRLDPPKCYTNHKKHGLPQICPMCVRAAEAEIRRQKRQQKAAADSSSNSSSGTPTSTKNSGQTLDTKATSQASSVAHTSNHFQNDPSDVNNWSWHVPRRCFTDPGFQRVDPFAADRFKQLIEATEQRRREAYGPGACDPTRQGRHGWWNGQQWTTSAVRYSLPIGPCCAQAQLTKWLKEQSSKKVRDLGPHDEDRCFSVL